MGKTVIANQRKFRKRKKQTSFNPNRSYIDESVRLYLQDGGKITKIIPDENSYKIFMSMNDPSAANDFLNDGA